MIVAGTKKSWFPVVILFATAKEEVSHAMLCGQGRGEGARGYRLDSTVQPAQQCWQPTNNVNHDVGRACRMQPLETREQTPERKWRIFFPFPVVNRFLPRPNSAQWTVRFVQTLHHYGETIFVEYRPPSGNLYAVVQTFRFERLKIKISRECSIINLLGLEIE